MMGRQRTINDAAFWRSPRMAGRTHEDRATLSYLLTCPFSNIIGVYEFVPRIAASEMGWDTESQLLPVLRRLSECRFIELDEDLSYVWVRIWWDHNSPTMSVAGTLRQRTFQQIAAIPLQWREAFMEDFVARLPTDSKKVGNLQTIVQAEMEALFSPRDRVSIPYSYPTDREHVNTNDNFTFNTTTNSLRFPDALTPVQCFMATKALAKFDSGQAQQLLDELSLRLEGGGIRGDPLHYFAGLIRNVEDRALMAREPATRRRPAAAASSMPPSSSARAAEELARIKQIAKSGIK
jgi:hypothetical protein